MEFIETEKGVCGISPVTGDYTLCGNAFGDWNPDTDDENKYQGGGDDVGIYEFSLTNSKTITCPDCARLVLACRGVRVKVNPNQ